MKLDYSNFYLSIIFGLSLMFGFICGNEFGFMSPRFLIFGIFWIGIFSLTYLYTKEKFAFVSNSEKVKK